MVGRKLVAVVVGQKWVLVVIERKLAAFAVGSVVGKVMVDIPTESKLLLVVA
ncbi:MAG TPA: hypothetical protein V6D11_13840 [Waterburya sp.]